MTSRRQFTSQLASLALLTAAGLPRMVAAQQTDTARLLVGFPPGGGSDIVARRLADKLRGKYAPTVIVENKPGAAMQIAVTTLKGSAPDGATLLLSPPAPFTVYPFTYKTLPYQPDDVVPVSLVCTFAFAIGVGPMVPESVRTLKDFLDWARANPAKASFGSPAAGATPHLVGSLLSKMSGVELTHVAYKGDAPGMQDLLGGQVAAYSSLLASYLPQIKAGRRVRVLAISGATRDPLASDLPTYAEQGYPINNREWFGIFVPKGTPPATVQRASSAVQAAVAEPDFVKFMADMGFAAQSSTPQQLAERMHDETEEWRVNIKKIGFSADS
jgi:tripartite-type tricarboxylate transporter receptor subunit TctC